VLEGYIQDIYIYIVGVGPVRYQPSIASQSARCHVGTAVLQMPCQSHHAAVAGHWLISHA